MCLFFSFGFFLMFFAASKDTSLFPVHTFSVYTSSSFMWQQPLLVEIAEIKWKQWNVLNYHPLLRCHEKIFL